MTATIDSARAWISRHRMLSAGIALFAALVIVVMWLTGAYAARVSATFTERAREANAAGDYDRGIAFGLAALNGHDAPLIGFSGDAARTELLRAIVQSRRLASFQISDVRATFDNAQFSPDGTLVIAQATYFYGSDQPIRYGAEIWNAQTGERVQRLQWEGDLGNTLGAAISPDNRFALTSDSDARVRLWTLADGTLHKEFPRTLEGLTTNAAFAPDGSRVVVNDYGGVYVWDLATDAVRMLSNERSCGAPEFSPDGAFIAAFCDYGSALIWDVESGALRQTLRVSERSIHDDVGTVFSPDGERLAVGRETEVSIWDWRRGRRLVTLPGGGSTDNDRPNAVAFSADGARLLTSAWESNTEARLWDIAARRQIAALQWNAITLGPSVSWSADSTRAVTSTDQQGVHLWDMGATPDPMRSVPVARGRSAPLSSLSAGALFRYGCAQSLTDMVGVPFYAEIYAIDPSLADKVCGSNLWGRISAALGAPDRSAINDEVVDLPNARIVLRSSGQYQPDAVTTLWIEDNGRRMARREVIDGQTFEAYWDGRALYWRVGDLPVVSGLGFAEPRYVALDGSGRGFVPGMNLQRDGRVHRYDDAPPAAPRTETRTIAGVEADCWGANACSWRGVDVYSVDDSKRIEATEIEENARIPDELRALAAEAR